MTHFNFKILLFLSCSVFCVTVSCSLLQMQDVKIVKPLVHVASLCTNKSIIFARSTKLICLICKGFDPSCFGITTSTTTPSPTTTTSSTSTTTPASTTTSSSTTTPATSTSSTTTSTTEPTTKE